MERAGFCFVDCLAVARIMQKVSFSYFWLLKTCFNLFIFSSPILIFIGTSKKPTAGPQPVKLRVFWLGRLFLRRRMLHRGRSEAALGELRGEFFFNSLRLRVCFSLMQICGAHYKEPAKAAGIPFARGASRCKAMELVLPSLTDRGCGACASNERADGATCRKRP